MIQFILLVNKQGQTRVAKYYDAHRPAKERVLFETEIVRKCLLRADDQCGFVEHLEHRVVYRRYASLFFVVGIDQRENELAIYEFIHNLVELFDNYFHKVCELDIMFNLEKAHILIDEMIVNGCIAEASQTEVLDQVALIDLEASRGK